MLFLPWVTVAGLDMTMIPSHFAGRLIRRGLLRALLSQLEGWSSDRQSARSFSHSMISAPKQAQIKCGTRVKSPMSWSVHRENLPTSTHVSLFPNSHLYLGLPSPEGLLFNNQKMQSHENHYKISLRIRHPPVRLQSHYHG